MIYIQIKYHINFWSGASGHQRTKAKMGSAKSGKSDHQYIQALSSERTAEKIKGKSTHNDWC